MTKSRGLRAVFIILGTALALWLVLTKTASNLYWDRQPALALKFDGANNFALSQLANSVLLSQQQNSLDLHAGSRFALEALRFSPRDSSSLAVLAFAADAGEFKTPGLPLAKQSFAYSKRTLLSQLYFIQKGAKEGNIDDVLAFYNLALTTHPNSQALLLPRLYAVLVVPQVRSKLIKLLATDPTWKKDFWLGLTDLRPIPEAALQLVEEARPNPSALISGLAPRLVQGLVGDRRFDAAAHIADLQAGPDSVVRGARSLDDFSKGEPAPPVDWEFDSSGSYNAIPGKSELLLSVRGSQAVTFARRLLLLPAGKTFLVKGEILSHFGKGELSLSVSCSSSGASLASRSFEISREGSQPLAVGPFAIPANCPQQLLTVTGGSLDTAQMEIGLSSLALSQGSE